MKAEELRIGNLIQDDLKRLGSIKSITKTRLSVKLEHSTLNTSCKYIDPIPLTEEWLVKLGFEYRPDLCFWDLSTNNPYKAHHILQMSNTWTWFIDFDDNGDDTRLIKGFDYIHQLQNLYFALTGEELTLKI